MQSSFPPRDRVWSSAARARARQMMITEIDKDMCRRGKAAEKFVFFVKLFFSKFKVNLQINIIIIQSYKSFFKLVR